MENIEQRVKKIVAEQLGVNESEIKTESSFVDDLGADSLDTVELVMALEEEFECEIPTKRPRRSPPSSRRSTTSTPTSRISPAHFSRAPCPRYRASLRQPDRFEFLQRFQRSRLCRVVESSSPVWRDLACRQYCYRSLVQPDRRQERHRSDHPFLTRATSLPASPAR